MYSFPVCLAFKKSILLKLKIIGISEQDSSRDDASERRARQVPPTVLLPNYNCDLNKGFQHLRQDINLLDLLVQ